MESKPEPKPDPKATRSSDDLRAFSLTFRSENGRIGPELFQHMEILRVDGPSGQAVTLLNRQGGDLPHPIGLFGTVLTARQVETLAKVLNDTKWGQLPKASGGDLKAATLTLDYARGKVLVQRSFNARGSDFMRAVGPVIDQVGTLGEALEAHPLRALAVTLERAPRGFKLVLKNIGTGPVLIADPRLPGPHPGTTRGTISVAYSATTEPSMFAPPQFHPLALQPASKDQRVIALGPGETHEVESMPWAPSQPGLYLAAGSWEDYVGPEVDPKSLMPFIPRTDELDDKRPYVLRGAAFADGLDFVIEKPRR